MREYETDSEGILILKCTERQDGCGLITEPCPFCGKRHFHGHGEGHRVAHCLETKEITLPSGKVVCNTEYILKKEPI